MTKSFLTLFIVLVIACNAVGSDMPTWMKEKQPVKITIFLGPGLGLPQGDLSDEWMKFLHGFSRLDFSASPRLSIWAGVDYNLFKPREKQYNELKLKITNIAFDLKLNLGNLQSEFNPYFFSGLGIAIPNLGESSLREKEANPLIEFGGGVEINKVFIQGRYVNTFGENTSVSYVPISVGVMF